MRAISVFLLITMSLSGPIAYAQVSETEEREMSINDQTSVESANVVQVREHPKTRKPFVVITSATLAAENHTDNNVTTIERPDYMMLSSAGSKDITYNGPVSDRKKVYVFAAGLAATGIAIGAVGAAIAPAATTSAAGGGAAYSVAGAAVSVGAVSAAVGATRSKEHEDEFLHEAKSETIMQDVDSVRQESVHE